MTSKQVNLDFFNFSILIHLDDAELARKTCKDFSFFLAENSKEPKFTINVKKDDAFKLPKSLVATAQSQNSITYVENNKKYQDYYGKAWTILEGNSLKLIYRDINCVHEILYLVILSYSGKYMDSKGYHKVHACGFNFERQNIILMMPSKGGKTTIFTDMLSDPKINIISDDTPVISRTGKVYPFPPRLGCEDKNDLLKKFPYIDENEIYEFQRVYFSKKYLLSINSLKNKVFAANGKTKFVLGVRSTREKPKMKKVSKLRFLLFLIPHFIVGVGLPMVIEHFFRLGAKDFFTNSKIFLSRAFTAFVIVIRHEGYVLETSSNKALNREVLMELLD